jgi:glycosyltransferase involved in cell wall biosynthesis
MDSIMAKKKIVVFGPGPRFKGGLANYTTSLAKAFDSLPETEVHLVSWTQQYPAIIPRDFIDRASRTDKLAGTNVKVHYVTNYNNPLSWSETVHLIKEIHPHQIIFQWSIAIQGLPLSYIAKNLKKGTDAEIIFDLHFVIQKEQSSIDRILSQWALKWADTYVAHAYKTVDELQQLFPEFRLNVSENGDRKKNGVRSVVKLYHPVYDMFVPDPHFDREAFKRQLGLKENVFLFFGFIRKYKGLHHCIKAFAEVAKQRNDVSLLIVGESFWNTLDQNKWTTKLKKAVFGTIKSLLVNKTDDEQNYNPLDLINELGIADKTVTINTFVANEDVHKYFQVSDAILLFYEYATPSGVESMAYNFKMPALATHVGHFPETIKHGYNGYLAKAEDTQDMAKQMLHFLENPINRENVAQTAAEFSWKNYATAILYPLLQKEKIEA